MPLSLFLNSDIYDDYFFYAITIPFHFDFRFREFLLVVVFAEPMTGSLKHATEVLISVHLCIFHCHCLMIILVNYITVKICGRPNTTRT